MCYKPFRPKDLLSLLQIEPHQDELLISLELQASFEDLERICDIAINKETQLHG
jgi:hypothetical protein